MARDRARSSFTVEVRRGRTTGIETDPKRSLWRGLDLAGEAARHEPVMTPAAAPAIPTRDPFAPRPAARRPDAPQGRVLPSLLPTEPTLVEEPAPEPPAPEVLPRVRRPRPARVRAETVLESPVTAVVEDDAQDTDADEPGTVSDPLGQPRLRRRAPRGERVLRAGERWKRRLPRSLW